MVWLDVKSGSPPYTFCSDLLLSVDTQTWLVFLRASCLAKGASICVSTSGPLFRQTRYQSYNGTCLQAYELLLAFSQTCELSTQAGFTNTWKPPDAKPQQLTAHPPRDCRWWCSSWGTVSHTSTATAFWKPRQWAEWLAGWSCFWNRPVSQLSAVSQVAACVVWGVLEPNSLVIILMRPSATYLPNPTVSFSNWSCDVSGSSCSIRTFLMAKHVVCL